MPPINNITILGGGLTGLTLAYRLSRLLQTLPALSPQTQHARAHRDTKITLLEKSDRAGGWVHSSNRIVQIPRTSENEEGKKVEEVVNVDITLEAGPRSIRPKGSIGAAYMLKLVSCPPLSFHHQSLTPSLPQIQDLSLESSILSVSHTHPSAQNRFILSRATDRLVRLPSGLRDVMGVPSSGCKTLDAEGRSVEGTDLKEERRLRKLLRRGIASDLFRSRSPAPKIPTTSSGYPDTTIHQLVSSTLGPNVANSLISAMVHGIYAADSRKLSVRSTFPMLWDAMYPSSTSTTTVKKTASLVWNLLSSSLFGKKTVEKTPLQERKAAEEAEAWAQLGELDVERKKWSVYGLKGGLGVLTDKMQREIANLNVDVVTNCVVNDMKVQSDGKIKVSVASLSGACRH